MLCLLAFTHFDQGNHTGITGWDLPDYLGGAGALYVDAGLRGVAGEEGRSKWKGTYREISLKIRWFDRYVVIFNFFTLVV